MTQKTTNEKPVPHIPLKFEDAVKAALETKPESKTKKKKKVARPSRSDKRKDSRPGTGKRRDTR